ncbi:unnamed protein product [Mytilus edulis]|uniref:Uncharacterized protein n=1 Tax=Mytilus edulis TaxID=6550 RepID=A0A8S3PSF5_MYTED|nr:unnamed protein product [Mytilus edulis]
MYGVIIVRSLVGLLPLVACDTANFSGIRCTEELKQVLQTDFIHVCGVIIVNRSLVGLLPLVACGTVNLSGIRCTEELKQVLQTDLYINYIVPDPGDYFVAYGTVNFSGIRCTEELKQVLQNRPYTFRACCTVNFSGISYRGIPDFISMYVELVVHLTLVVLDVQRELKQVLQTDSIQACRSNSPKLDHSGWVTSLGVFLCTANLVVLDANVEELKQVLQTEFPVCIHVWSNYS